MIRYLLVFALFTAEPATLEAQAGAAPPPLALSMRDAIRMALAPQGNSGIDIAEESVRAAQARVRESRAAALPSVESFVAGRNQVMNLGALGFESAHLPLPALSNLRSVGPFNTLDARVQVRQSILNPAIGLRSRAVRADVETARTDTEDLRDRVAAQAARLYLVALRAASAQDLAQARVEAAGAALQEATNRNAAGNALSLDVSQARVRLSTEKHRLLAARLDRDRSALELLTVLNRDLATPLELTDQLAFTPVDTVTPEEAMALALRSRADLAVLRQRIEAARLHDDSIRAERLPSVEAYADGGTLGTGFTTLTGTYSVGVSLRVPVFNGGIRAARREENLARLRQEELRSSMLKKEIELQVREALIKLEAARGEIEISNQEVEVAREALVHHRRRHDEGIGGQADILEAQAGLAKANDNRAAALYSWNEARIELMQAMGTIRSLGQ